MTGGSYINQGQFSLAARGLVKTALALQVEMVGKVLEEVTVKRLLESKWGAAIASGVNS
jgi:hypothetical protein